VSLSKMINRGDVFLSYSNEDRASAFLGDELERLARASQTSQRKLPPSIIDQLFHVMTPALHRETDRIDPIDQLNVEPRAREGTDDYRVVRRLGPSRSTRLVSNDCAPFKRPALRSARHSAETIEGLQQIRDAIQNHRDGRGMQSFLATLKDKAIDVV
jgi:hypothetical protein